MLPITTHLNLPHAQLRAELAATVGPTLQRYLTDPNLLPP
jgi:hypothetical protein